ncbi:nicotinamidase [Calliopsis andreniformis]|uniref:nicotinamidase n=1 Tax=Calliopsis andreniformis TaxID=337506 RepID=UPI003FCE835D
MRTKDSMMDSFGGKQLPIEAFLDKLDLEGERSELDLAKFRTICLELFPGESEWRVEEVFNLLDRNRDGVVKGEELKTFHEWLKTVIQPVNALLIIDVQNDFIDGSLALRNCEGKQDGLDVVEPINRLIKDAHFDKIIYSFDWHPENHISFYENLHLRELHPDSKVTKEKAKPFDTVTFAEPHVEQTLWPKHCVIDTWGAQLHKDLVVAPDSAQVRKGKDPNVEAYSVFHDSNSEGTGELQTILRDAGVTHVYVCGLAYDVCVKNACLDGLRFGYPVAVVDDCCRGVDLGNIEATKELITEKGGLIAGSDDVLALVNKEKRSLVMSHQSAKTMTSISVAESSANGHK